MTEEPSSRRQGCCQGHRGTWDPGNTQKTAGKAGDEGHTSTWEWAVLQKRRWLAEPGRSVRLRMWSLAEVVM